VVKQCLFYNRWFSQCNFIWQRNYCLFTLEWLLQVNLNRSGGFTVCLLQAAKRLKSHFPLRYFWQDLYAKKPVLAEKGPWRTPEKSGLNFAIAVIAALWRKSSRLKKPFEEKLVIIFLRDPNSVVPATTRIMPQNYFRTDEGMPLAIVFACLIAAEIVDRGLLTIV